MMFDRCDFVFVLKQENLNADVAAVRSTGFFFGDLDSVPCDPSPYSGRTQKRPTSTGTSDNASSTRTGGTIETNNYCCCRYHYYRYAVVEAIRFFLSLLICYVHCGLPPLLRTVHETTTTTTIIIVNYAAGQCDTVALYPEIVIALLMLC